MIISEKKTEGLDLVFENIQEDSVGEGKKVAAFVLEKKGKAEETEAEVSCATVFRYPKAALSFIPDVNNILPYW